MARPHRTTRKPNNLAGIVVRNSNLEFFLARAAQARTEAAATTLTHVRERCHRSEAAWQALAAKVKRTARLREDETKRKAEQLPQAWSGAANGAD